MTLTREQAHALYIVREYPGRTASELTQLYNTECFDKRFDDLAETTPGGLATRLTALRQRGLVTSFHEAVVGWEITPEGLSALDIALEFGEVEQTDDLCRVVTNLRTDGRIDWTLWLDGVEHGGGISASHSEAYRDVSLYLRDIGR